MTIKFEAIRNGNIVPVSLIIFNCRYFENDSFYMGIVGNESEFDAVKIYEKNVNEIIKVFKSYLIKNNIKLAKVIHIREYSDQIEIYNAYKENEHVLFDK